MTAFQKPPKLTPAQKREGKAHMSRVKLLPCVICGRAGPSDVHHCISQRFGGRRADDFRVIPLCKECHQVGPLAIHQSKRLWEETNGYDFDYLPVVADMLAGEFNV